MKTASRMWGANAHFVAFSLEIAQAQINIQARQRVGARQDE